MSDDVQLRVGRAAWSVAADLEIKTESSDGLVGQFADGVVITLASNTELDSSLPVPVLLGSIRALHERRSGHSFDLVHCEEAVPGRVHAELRRDDSLFSVHLAIEFDDSEAAIAQVLLAQGQPDRHLIELDSMKLLPAS